MTTETKPVRKSSITKVKHTRKADTASLVSTGTESFPDDSFAGGYYTGGNTSYMSILEPYFKPGTLHALSMQNNTLAQCVEAMEVNIDGTGHSIDLIEGMKVDETEKKLLVGFFSQPYPGKSMVTIRRALRADLEECGNAYIEVMRTGVDAVVMLNNQVSHDMRLVRLDDAVSVDKTIIRNGEEVTLQVKVRERRFVQMINGQKVYFKEFGASRDLNVKTGEWAKPGERLPLEDRASEIIHLTGKKEPKTPYGSPRWLNQLPSVLGSRKAEEFNLEYFDAGGLPPVMVIVQGGYLTDTVRMQLQNHLAGKGNKHRAVIVEATSSSGSLDGAGAVQIKVERFGGERLNDAMFQVYDKACEEHIRTAFRLPPMFLGKVVDFNFATAYTAYMVAEAQVFWPEREEFDELINGTIVRALGVKNYRFRSMPLTLVNVDNQLKALGMVADKHVDGEQIVSSLNEITGLALEFKEQAKPPPTPPPVGKIDPLTGLPYTQPVPTKHSDESVKGAPPKATEPTQKSDTPSVKELAEVWAAEFSQVGIAVPSMSPLADPRKVTELVAALKGEALTEFNNELAALTMRNVLLDPSGLGELCGCAKQPIEE